MERLIDETLRSLPQVFLEHELQAVKEELSSLTDLSGRFRSICRVSTPNDLIPSVSSPRHKTRLASDDSRQLSFSLAHEILLTLA